MGCAGMLLDLMREIIALIATNRVRYLREEGSRIHHDIVDMKIAAFYVSDVRVTRRTMHTYQ